MRGRELVGKNIRRIRVEKGVSQERLAFDANVDRSYLGGIERCDENRALIHSIRSRQYWMLGFSNSSCRLETRIMSAAFVPVEKSATSL
ncbi:helix-turn-helix domain-containing protein [Sphingopyxis sp. JAI128]|uniref:helix-turn-helix domain-containing protein n=1 Tax=Sphingopyxis sp. JAI128 TaxID=2723066 RepID=UPI0021A986AA|nr:helix-turn-helix transcriptional regulator [Sphingopyxis sp. JAI128]